MQLMLIRQVLLRAKFFARKKHDVRVRNPRKKKISNLKKTFDLGFKFEKKNITVCFSNVYVA